MTACLSFPLAKVGHLAIAAIFRAVAIVALVAAFTLSGPAVARAENWVLTTISSEGDRYYADIQSLSSDNSIVKSWQSVEFSKTQRTPSKKPYKKAFFLRLDDCAKSQYMFSEYIYRDSEGKVVESGRFNSEVINVLPGSVAESYKAHVCALSAEPKIDPILDDISVGDWELIGFNKDREFTMYLKKDDVTDLGNNTVGLHTRSDYTLPSLKDDLFINYESELYVIKCDSREIALYGTDAYIGNRRVISNRTTSGQFKFGPIQSGSLGDTAASIGCKAPRVAIKPTNKDNSNGFSFGTAWAVEKGYLVTASHVVEGGGLISVYANGEKVGTALRVSNDTVNDIAVLRFSGSLKVSVLRIADKPARLGQSVFTLGFPVPGVLGQRIKMTAGEISSTSGMQDDVRQVQISIPIQQGNSGGPIIGWDGKVVGVVHAKLSSFSESGSGLSPENVNYAVKTAYIRPMIEELDDLGNYNVLKFSGNPDQVVEEARKAVFMLVVQQD
jgi:S1-C subfamily serine protease